MLVGGGRFGVTGGDTTPLCRTAWRPGGAKSQGAVCSPKHAGLGRAKPCPRASRLHSAGCGNPGPQQENQGC